MKNYIVTIWNNKWELLAEYHVKSKCSCSAISNVLTNYKYRDSVIRDMTDNDIVNARVEC